MNLLINESPLQVLPSLAVKVGLNQALVLQQMYYWLRISKNIRDGHKWVYKTLEDWHKEFPFWSKSTLERIIRKLEEEQLIVVGNYNRLKMDRTKWYRLNHEAINMLFTVHDSQHEVMQDMKMTDSKNATYSPPSQQHDEMDSSNLTVPIPINHTKNTPLNFQHKKKKCARASVFHFYEENGFGPLNPYVTGKIKAWLDDLSEELVRFALTTAIENNVPKWNYVESVLRDWQRKHIKSVAEAEAYKQSFKNKKPVPTHNPKRTEIIPEWFQKRHEPIIPAEVPININFEAERLKILASLKGPSSQTRKT